MLEVIALLLVSVISGMTVGMSLGFSFESHSAILNGVRPRTTNRVILFLARPTSELNASELVMFVAMMLLWLTVLLGLCGLPFYLHSRLAPGSKTLLVTILCVFIVAALIFAQVGRAKWLSLTRDAV